MRDEIEYGRGQKNYGYVSVYKRTLKQTPKYQKRVNKSQNPYIASEENAYPSKVGGDINDLINMEFKQKKYRGVLDADSPGNKDIFIETDSEIVSTPKNSNKKEKNKRSCAKLIVEKTVSQYLDKNNINNIYNYSSNIKNAEYNYPINAYNKQVQISRGSSAGLWEKKIPTQSNCNNGCYKKITSCLDNNCFNSRKNIYNNYQKDTSGNNSNSNLRDYDIYYSRIGNDQFYRRTENDLRDSPSLIKNQMGFLFKSTNYPNNPTNYTQIDNYSNDNFARDSFLYKNGVMKTSQSKGSSYRDNYANQNDCCYNKINPYQKNLRNKSSNEDNFNAKNSIYGIKYSVNGDNWQIRGKKKYYDKFMRSICKIQSLWRGVYVRELMTFFWALNKFKNILFYVVQNHKKNEFRYFISKLKNIKNKYRRKINKSIDYNKQKNICIGNYRTFQPIISETSKDISTTKNNNDLYKKLLDKKEEDYESLLVNYNSLLKKYNELQFKSPCSHKTKDFKIKNINDNGSEFTDDKKTSGTLNNTPSYGDNLYKSPLQKNNTLKRFENISKNKEENFTLGTSTQKYICRNKSSRVKDISYDDYLKHFVSNLKVDNDDKFNILNQNSKRVIQMCNNEPFTFKRSPRQWIADVCQSEPFTFERSPKQWIAIVCKNTPFTLESHDNKCWKTDICKSEPFTIKNKNQKYTFKNNEIKNWITQISNNEALQYIHYPKNVNVIKIQNKIIKGDKLSFEHIKSKQKIFEINNQESLIFEQEHKKTNNNNLISNKEMLTFRSLPKKWQVEIIKNAPVTYERIQNKQPKIIEVIKNDSLNFEISQTKNKNKDEKKQINIEKLEKFNNAQFNFIYQPKKKFVDETKIESFSIPETLKQKSFNQKLLDKCLINELSIEKINNKNIKDLIPSTENKEESNKLRAFENCVVNGKINDINIIQKHTAFKNELMNSKNDILFDIIGNNNKNKNIDIKNNKFLVLSIEKQEENYILKDTPIRENNICQDIQYNLKNKINNPISSINENINIKKDEIKSVINEINLNVEGKKKSLEDKQTEITEELNVIEPNNHYELIFRGKIQINEIKDIVKANKNVININKEEDKNDNNVINSDYNKDNEIERGEGLEINPLEIKKTKNNNHNIFISYQNKLEVLYNKESIYTEKAKKNLIKIILPIRLKTVLRECVRRYLYPILVQKNDVSQNKEEINSN